MEINYEECLNEFKKSLDGGSEFDILIEGIINNVSTNRIRWFDVGIGDGKFLKKIVTTLENKGYMIEVSGIDASKESVEKAKERFPKGKIVCGDFNETELKGKYDVFSFNQTMYYFHNKNKIVDKCKKHLAEGGLLVGILWSKKDSIFQYHQKVFGKWTIGAFTSEDLKELFTENNGVSIVYDELFEGTTNFALWKKKDSLNKNLNVISRIPLAKGISQEDYDLALKLIDELKDVEPRFNGVVIAKKPYEIPNFTRENMEVTLKKRFPNFQNLVKYIKGDLEALFMCSWEKETEYLSENIPKGRVLEICCAAGLKSVMLAKRHEVVALDINESRLKTARENAKLFGVEDNTYFKNVNAEKINELCNLGNFDAIYVDVDWREDLSDPIKKQNIDPFKTCPKTDILYKNLRNLYPNVPIIFKISPFVRVKDLTKLDPCVIEELHIDGKFLSYNVYFEPKIQKSRWQEIHLYNEEMV